MHDKCYITTLTKEVRMASHWVTLEVIKGVKLRLIAFLHVVLPNFVGLANFI